MIEGKHFNNVICISKIKGKNFLRNNNNPIVNLYYKTSAACVKLGVGKMYDDHCATSLFLDKIAYQNILTPFKSEGVEILSDIDREIFSNNITFNIFVEGSYEGSFKADKQDLEDLFVEKKQLWSEHGMVGWITCIPEFSSYEFTKSPQIFTKNLKTIWDIPENLKFFEEGDFEAGIEPTDYLELGYKKKKFAFIDDEKLRQRVKEKEEKVLKAKEYEDWMDELKNSPLASKKVKEKIDELYYLKNKDFIDKQMQEHIDKIKSISLYKIGKSNRPLKKASWTNKYSPLWEEYKKTVESYEKIYDNLMIVDSAAGEFLADKRDKVWNVEVPDNLKGLFIGKGGKNIKKLAEEYNVKINVLDYKEKKENKRIFEQKEENFYQTIRPKIKR
ncbi:KH domain-containing protein [Caminibacter mediatlanticus]|uniref:K Homology domain-containing protein n=1 Tax=Caminibacter mediatlanticus TB-2 TaxID=391592 RepID=A0AAI9AFY5_9BACT|nr:KH domain-containing protein [Caminibacter mediatlanticus]EDM22906.1 hypothetical protein CMTB2_05442 [Caminibacter mediatlanticus TB-2]